METTYPARLLALSLFAATVAAGAPQAMAQAASHPFAQSSPVPGQYIVVFRNSVSNPAAEAANVISGQGGQLRHVYTSAIKGFAASLPDAALAALRSNPNVDYIEQDQTVSLNQETLVPQVQTGATWGLDRIDEVVRQLDGSYHYNYRGVGVNAFIIDTGIRADHLEFSGRLLSGSDKVGDGNGTNDCNGHGTHVAGTVGGTTWGVAKAVSLIPVRVLNCSGSGTYAGVIAGIDWVAGQKRLTPGQPAVANMSLGGGASTSVNAAVAGAVNAGVTMVVAAGNDNRNACNYSPASAPSAITVGATTSSDARASYSNYGSCVDIFAPGSGITSAWIGGSTSATNTISGTSMATPHVTGVAALALAANPAASPAAVTSFLLANATPNRISSAGTGSPNLLLYSLATGVPAEPVIQTVAVSAIDGKPVKIVGSNWRAYATVTLHDLSSSTAPVQNATITGSFSPGGTASCVTDSNSRCTLNSAKISAASTTFTVTGVSGTSLNYVSGSNSVTSITIKKP